MVEMRYVQSSSVDQIGYDEERNELHMVFKDSSTVYVYLNVPPHVYEALRDAPSMGSYFNREIKNAYEFVKR